MLLFASNFSCWKSPSKNKKENLESVSIKKPREGALKQEKKAKAEL